MALSVAVVVNVSGVANCVWFRLLAARDGGWGQSMIGCGVQQHREAVQQSDGLWVSDREVSATDVGPSSPSRALAPSVRVVHENSSHLASK